MTTYDKKRLVAAGLLVFIVLAAANYYLSLGVFPRYAGLIMMSGVLMVLIFITRFAPTQKEFEEHRQERNVLNTEESLSDDRSERKKTLDESTAGFLPPRKKDASVRAREEWLYAAAASLIAITLPVTIEIGRRSGSNSISVVAGLGIAYSCYLGIKDLRQGSKRGFILKFLVPLILCGISMLTVFLGAGSFWTLLS